MGNVSDQLLLLMLRLQRDRVGDVVGEIEVFKAQPREAKTKAAQFEQIVEGNPPARTGGR